MRTHEDDILSEKELTEMLTLWNIPDAPTEQLRTRIFSQRALPDVPNIRGGFARVPGKSAALSVMIHAAAFALMLWGVQNPVMQKKVHQVTDLYFTPVKAYRPKLAAAADKASGGGGMKDNAASHGQAPQFARKQFVAPAMAILNPKLPVVPTISAAAPQITADQYGDPISKLDQSGLGVGYGTGLGNGRGDGFGPGDGHGIGGGAYAIGGDVAAPILISKTEPEYSEEARKAKYSGSVLLTIIVDQNGLPRDIRVVRPLGLGLDEKAIEAVRNWRFRPGTKGGRPVAVQAQVEVTFRLL
jgi:protein TonB